MHLIQNRRCISPWHCSRHVAHLWSIRYQRPIRALEWQGGLTCLWRGCRGCRPGPGDSASLSATPPEPCGQWHRWHLWGWRSLPWLSPADPRVGGTRQEETTVNSRWEQREREEEKHVGIKTPPGRLVARCCPRGWAEAARSGTACWTGTCWHLDQGARPASVTSRGKRPQLIHHQLLLALTRGITADTHTRTSKSNLVLRQKQLELSSSCLWTSANT